MMNVVYAAVMELLMAPVIVMAMLTLAADAMKLVLPAVIIPVALL